MLRPPKISKAPTPLELKSTHHSLSVTRESRLDRRRRQTGRSGRARGGGGWATNRTYKIVPVLMAVAFPPHIMALSKVQRLYDACDVVFASPAAGAGAPTLGEIRWLQKILGEPPFYLVRILRVVVFAGNLRCWDSVRLDGVEAADVGIDDGENPAASSSSDDELSPKGARLLSARAFTRITYVHIHQCEDFSVRACVGFRFVTVGQRNQRTALVVWAGLCRRRAY